MSDATIRSRIRGGRWQRAYPGVYGTFSGALSRRALLWAAILKAGSGAQLSHDTAAELDGLLDEPSVPIHVTVPGYRRVEPIRGVRLHRSIRAEEARHPARLPPRTRAEETVLDLVEASQKLDRALTFVTKACGRRLTTAKRLENAMARRPLMRWREEMRRALNDVASGAQSWLELRYLRDVERAHGLPAGRRQYAVRRRGSTQYQDVRHRRYQTVIELDGRLGHVEDGRWRDMWRDNAATADGDVTLRYGLADIVERPCSVAAQVARVLQARGWTGSPRPCGPSCDLAEDYRSYAVRDPPRD